MKIKTECITCLVERAKFECDLVFSKEEKKIKTLKSIVKFIGENLRLDTVPADLGTVRERIIKKRSGAEDPYFELKKGSNRVAMAQLGVVNEFYEKSGDKIEALIKIAAVANSMEYGVKGYDYDKENFSNKFRSSLEERLVGDIESVKSTITKYRKILYLTDNCGEIIFDKFVCEKLVKLGKEVIVAPKSEPIIDDATVQDLKAIGFKLAIVPSGSYVGLSLAEAPKEFLDLFWDKRYLVFAKGMGYYETISEFEEELKGRLIYIFKAKCSPVAESAIVNKGDLVATCV
jgi:hypothetical protein